MAAYYSYASGYGQMQAIALQAGCPAFGKIFVVCPAADSNYQRLSAIFKDDPDGLVRLYTTLEGAYAAASSNQDDVILLTGNATHNLTAPILWAKNRVHLVGVDGTNGRLLQQGAKVQCATTGTTPYVIKDTGVRNSFVNVKFIQSSTQATALTCFEGGGEGTFFKNCSFTFGVADNLDLATAHEFLAGTDSATFVDCTFGQDTLLTSAARSVFHIDQVNGFEFKSNFLDRCRFVISSSDAGAQLVKMDAAGDVLFANEFKDCSFVASLDSAGGIALTRAVSTANGLVKGTLLFSYPRTFGCTDFGTNGTNNDNLFLVAPLAVATDVVGVAPIAT